jgi:Gpi18-like mannosyltransferase
MSKPNWLNNRLLVIIVWILAIFIRLYGASTPAQYYDIGTFEAWSRSFWTHGPRLFFDSVWSDYLPLPILTFAPISLISDLFHAPFALVFKLVHIFIELVLIIFISKSTTYNLRSITYLLLLSPALIGDTAFWGQVDSVPALLALLSFTTSSPILLGLAVAYKPIMILIAPILWIIHIKQGSPWWRFPLFSSLIFFATALPTGGLNFIPHIFTRIFAQAGTYPYLTINAFNFYSLVPNLSWISDSTSVLNISGRNLGFIVFFFLSLITLNHWRKSNFSPQSTTRVAATIFIVFYTFTTRMHERHLLFGLPFLALAAVNETWLLFP